MREARDGMRRGLTMAALLCALSPPGAHAQTGGTRPGCQTLLADTAVAAAVGRAGGVAEKAEIAPGDTRCTWTWPDGASVAVSVSDAAAVSARAADTKCCPNASAPVLAQFFDYAVRAAVDLGAEPPAPLTGMGVRAALFFEEGFLKLLVQRSDSVAQIVGAEITREQLLAIGRALAAR